ncbi:glycosyltransferase family 4 protein [candidate division KSB1 bacterium]|nr:glycosyltransferase family 4 protein [candidate division KSB1 bacterium]
MKIIYFLNSYPTQHKIVAHDEMIEMSRRGHQITVISVWGGERNLIKSAPFKIIYLKQTIRLFNLLSLFLKYWFKSLQHLFFLRKYLGIREAINFFSNYPDLGVKSADRIHCHFASNAALRGYLISKFFNIPFSCTGHHSELIRYPEPYLEELILQAKPFITISNYKKKVLMRKFSLSEDKIEVNYCGVDTEYFNRKGVPYPKDFNIISVTALRHVKGVKYLIEACSILKNKNIPCSCLIIGGGKDFEILNKYILDLNLHNCVKLLGPIHPEKIRDYLLQVSVFVLPSLSEGIPISLMEAMAMELPVIATNITGIPELIDDGKNGILVEPKDSITLAQVIERLIKNPDLCKKLGRLARAKIEKDFNLKRNVKVLEELLLNS